MTPDAFIRKWKANIRAERAASQEHFIDLCRVLGEPTPNEDPDGSTYAFEKGAIKATGGDGWADVWRRGRFAWEYKGKHKDLEAAHRQLLLYAGALENPPLLIVSDIERIVIRTNWTGYASERHELLLEDLAQPARLAILKWAFSDPDRLRPAITRQGLTEKAAAEFAEIAKRLRDRGHNPQAVAHFLARLAFCAFADDTGLLPRSLFDRMLTAARRRPEQSAALADELFAAMANKGGWVGYDEVPWFNGGLFDDAPALPLDADDIGIIQRAAALDWAEIDPSILGTLFERGLDPDKRSQLGAHYTDRDKIEALIDPVIRRPLLAEWDKAKAGIEAARTKAETAKSNTAARRRAETEARALYTAFLERLRGFRVLDPACGSGNFLYLSLIALKDIELRAGLEAEALGLQREFLMGVGPEQVLGIEINPYAAELARVSVWIGHIQWAVRNGLATPENPILRSLDTIETRDAVLAEDGTPAVWPKADAIVGNPPFLGDKMMIGVMGEPYVDRLRAAYTGRVPGGADLVCYWFEQARDAITHGRVERVGLVGTNSIRGGANRIVLDRVGTDATIFEAWSDEPWSVEGAAVRVSLVSFARDASLPFRLDGREVSRINSDLTSATANLTTARPLADNQSVAFNGIQKTGPFEVDGDVARGWLSTVGNPNGLPNANVLRPYWNGIDATRRIRDSWIVDFGTSMTESEAAQFIEPFAHVMTVVKPVRAVNKLVPLRELWWRHWRPRAGMRSALSQRARYIVTPEVSKHRVFVWLPLAVLPDKNLIVIARDDDAAFGILHSCFHETWSLRLCTWLGVGNDPRYTPSTTFETFPFPEGLTPNLPAASYAQDPRAIAIAEAVRALTEARDRWLNPAELVEHVPEVVPGFPDRIVPRNAAAEQALKKRTLTNLYNTRGTPEGAWLDALHRRLDEAVAAAYGWPADISPDDALAALLALNHARPHATRGRGGETP
jgi:type II restriction/modification system DNA methylase subunit YeeA